MSTTITTPAVYVGTYHKYNCGSIFGKWFDLTEFNGREDFYEACQALHADEWDAEFMFQDWEGIPSQFVSECSIDWDFIAAYKRAEEEGREPRLSPGRSIPANVTMTRLMMRTAARRKARKTMRGRWWRTTAC
jgi:antirestriction protein